MDNITPADFRRVFKRFDWQKAEIEVICRCINLYNAARADLPPEMQWHLPEKAHSKGVAMHAITFAGRMIGAYQAYYFRDKNHEKTCRLDFLQVLPTHQNKVSLVDLIIAVYNQLNCRTVYFSGRRGWARMMRQVFAAAVKAAGDSGAGIDVKLAFQGPRGEIICRVSKSRQIGILSRGKLGLPLG